MPELFRTLTENFAFMRERQRAVLQAHYLNDAEWIAQDREGEWYAYSARPLASGLGWDCDENATFLFKGRPNSKWLESARTTPHRGILLLCHSPCSELPQRLAEIFSEDTGLQKDIRPS